MVACGMSWLFSLNSAAFLTAALSNSGGRQVRLPDSNVELV